MRNITVSVDDATYRRARIRAAELDTSVSALVREHLSALTRDDLSRDVSEAQGDRATTAAADATVRLHVQQLNDEARARATALAGRPIGDGQELLDFRRQLLKEVASDFRAKGIGLHMPGVVDREELYDRRKARLEAMLAAAEERGEDLEGELAALKASIKDAKSPDNALKSRR